LNVDPLARLSISGVTYFSSQYKNLLSINGRGTAVLQPWLVATGPDVIAMCPIGARELKTTEPDGNVRAEQDS
jgi:hypothetical protein